MSDSQDYYKVLGIPDTASESTIKQAFRTLARSCHPDLHPNNPQAELQFKQLQEAYDVLGDPIKRQQYDHFRAYLGTGEGFRTGESSSTYRDPNAQITDHYRIYTQGIQLASQRKYGLASQRFSQAIEMKPEFVEAYMGRCQVRYALGDDRGVLDDCSQILRLKTHVPQAHYYQGRARHRLNYVEHAILAYSQAIQLDQNYAPAYYYRGIARADIQDHQDAIADLKKASQFYRLSGNQEGVQRAESQLRQMRRVAFRTPFAKIQSFGNNGVNALMNPVGTNLLLFQTLSVAQSLQVGLSMGLSAIALSTVSLTFFWRSVVPLTWFELFLMGSVPLLTIPAVSNLGSVLTQQKGSHWNGHIFVAGTTLFPLGIGSILSRLELFFGIRFLWALGISTSCIMIMVLYAGLTQVSRFSEGQAVWIVILSTLASTALMERLYGVFMS